MLGEWYPPPGKCQVIWTITEGTISISHHAIQPLQTRILQAPFPQADKSNKPQPAPAPRSGGLNLTGQDNADAHMKRQIKSREVVVAITKGKLDFGPWEQIFYGEFDGRRAKRVLVKVIGE